jgi:hypothetical protein
MKEENINTHLVLSVTTVLTFLHSFFVVIDLKHTPSLLGETHL